ncbi:MULTISPECIES: hypothetical protein [Mycobacteroides]|uniref:hypothetical protein n=1 Tax=Mycobacteroides TaxID=670516 RepID=UPI0005E24E5A|nr:MULTISPECIES: hypothetical protein [Mycobacteroides]CPR84472.1 Uncharacterised protein [Mycobacteroides abscessus]CPS03394.1 Uncharacterised protein [Mycobacteroides abscessus]CPT04240.1 Uncharacterised protein [Mycobacteroides abscessus]CPU33449.1 Uncharacterised protein [Mycobacteroides abscessus]CPV12019.1 Uncharacterised protein [Mycobacteroides abscessus]
MTLVLALNAPNAICMSVDYRVTNSVTKKIIDPAAIKSLAIQMSPHEGGPRALIGYTGLAKLWGGMPTGRWLREVLRGRNQPFDDLMQHLLTQLNNRVMRDYKQPLIINVLAVHGKSGERRFWGGFSNLRKDFQLHHQFRYELMELETPCYYGNGSGAAVLKAGDYDDLVAAHLAVPATTEDHMALLAAVNRRVAQEDQTVSPYCYVMGIGADNEWVGCSRAFLEPGEDVPFSSRTITDGLDLTYMTEQAMKAFQSGTAPVFDADRIRRELERRK